MAIRGAGGTPGGVKNFFLGLAMMLAGGYLFLSSVRVYNFFGFGSPFCSIGPVHMTGGMLLFPLFFGFILIFNKASSLLGWLMTLGSLLAICVGIIASVHFSFAGMTLMDLLSILLLLGGGAGLFFGSLRSE